MCEYSSITTGDLKVHMMRKHTGEKPNKCNQCNYTCTSSGNLQSHTKMHTGEKPFRCNKCRKAFAYKSNLTKHVAIHMTWEYNKIPIFVYDFKHHLHCLVKKFATRLCHCIATLRWNALVFIACIASLPWITSWHYQLVLSWYLHQPESHQLSWTKPLSVSERDSNQGTRDTWVR